MWSRLSWLTINLWTVELSSNLTLVREVFKKMSFYPMFTENENEKSQFVHCSERIEKRIHF